MSDYESNSSNNSSILNIDETIYKSRQIVQYSKELTLTNNSKVEEKPKITSNTSFDREKCEIFLENSNLKREILRLKNELDNVLEALEHKDKQHSIKINELTQVVELKKSELSKKNNRISALESQVATLKTDLYAKEQDTIILKHKCQDLSKQSEELRGELKIEKEKEHAKFTLLEGQLVTNTQKFNEILTRFEKADLEKRAVSVLESPRPSSTRSNASKNRNNMTKTVRQLKRKKVSKVIK